MSPKGSNLGSRKIMNEKMFALKGQDEFGFFEMQQVF
jgi:hypothetical protein